jgi:hypothetical protein
MLHLYASNNSNIEMAFRILIYRDFLIQLSVVMRLLVFVQCVERLICCKPDMSAECHTSLSAFILKRQKQLSSLEQLNCNQN